LQGSSSSSVAALIAVTPSRRSTGLESTDPESTGR